MPWRWQVALITATPGVRIKRAWGRKELTETVSIDKLTPDQRNANQGTKRGLDLLDESLRQNGAGRSVLLDKHNRIIAGNKTVERAADIGIDDVIVVDSDGSKLVAVRRTDLDLDTDERARQLAYADNRVGQVDLAWDPSQIAADLEAGLDLSGMFYDWEIDKVLGKVADGPNDPAAEWQGMPEFEHDDLTSFRALIVHFATQEDVDRFAKLMGQEITDKTKFIWYPKTERIRYGEARES